MKKLVSSVFNRRRDTNKSKTIDNTVEVTENPYAHRINIIHRGSNDNHNHNGGEHTISTLTNNDHLPNNKQLGMNNHDETLQPMNKKGSEERINTGINHLSKREQMWYKQQMYLLEKDTANASSSPHRDSKNYAYYSSNDDSNGSSSNRGDSPSGVEEFDSLQYSTSADMESRHKNTKSKVRFQSNTRGSAGSRLLKQVSASQSQDDDTKQSSGLALISEDDTYTQQSSLFADGDTYTQQSSSLFTDGDTYTKYTNQSSSLFPHEEDQFEDVSLGSGTIGTFETETLDGIESILTPPPTTSTYRRFEMAEDGRKQHYQLGVGNSKTRASSFAKKQGTSGSGRRVTIHAPRPRDRHTEIDDAECPCFPAVVEELAGTFNDVKESFSQVLYAFYISEDQVDRIGDKLRDAKVELIELYHDQEQKKRLVRAAHGRPVAY